MSSGLELNSVMSSDEKIVFLGTKTFRFSLSINHNPDNAICVF